MIQSSILPWDWATRSFFDASTFEVCRYIADALLRSSHDGNAVNLARETALHTAASRVDVDMCKLLVDHGLDVNARAMVSMLFFVRVECIRVD
jgi:hypothetical protein